MLRRFWLLFAQVTTLCVAALFVVATLRPDLLARFTGRNNVILVEQPHAVVAGAKIDSLADTAKKAMPSVVNITAARRSASATRCTTIRSCVASSPDSRTDPRGAQPAWGLELSSAATGTS